MWWHGELHLWKLRNYIPVKIKRKDRKGKSNSKKLNVYVLIGNKRNWKSETYLFLTTKKKRKYMFYQ